MAGYIGSQTPVVSNGSQRKYTFTATAAQTVFTGMDIPNPQQIQVFQNGVRLVITTDYTVSSGTTVTLVNAASAGDSLVVILFADYQLLDQDLSGDFSVDSPTFVVDSTSNNIGVGVSSPSYPMTIASASNAVGLAINGRSSDGLGAAYWFANNGTTQHGDIRASASEFRISSTPASAVQTFYTNGSERLRVLSSGGITFNGDTAAANALDDYEEGTWTPTMHTSNADLTATIGIQFARYVKIGQSVYVSAYIVPNITAGSSGYAYLSNLPFTVTSASGAVFPWFNVHGTALSSSGGYLGGNGRMIAIANNSTSGINWNAGIQYSMFCCTYMTDA